ncbi:hypothetical protein KEM60_03325 [Austwickia sp. TVS 96-490-7B]|uniref:hypothetical protein n=1 Tax=Austwickia sp. TVS 96-490-7B TaxID=2830843 RepID=UPI001C567E14|nr:hypothetical protein [Austwickia sp. TVS 96-490-7B]MBW3087095.1 hypothetical protein [Austwickia sp. TVS 96-490-7B]
MSPTTMDASRPGTAAPAAPDLEAMLTRVGALSRTFATRRGPHALTDARSEAAGDLDGMVVTGSELADVDSGAARAMVAAHAQMRGLDPGPYAASLAFQRYVHRIAGLAVAVWTTERVVLDLQGATTYMLFVDRSPAVTVIPEPRIVPGAGTADLVDMIVDEHLLPVGQALHTVARLGTGNMWGNIAAGVAAATRQLSKTMPARDLLRDAEEIVGQRDRLARSGSFRVMMGADRERLMYDRNTCCRWYTSSGGKNCAWCSRLSPEERTRRFEVLIGVRPGDVPD